MVWLKNPLPFLPDIKDPEAVSLRLLSSNDVGASLVTRVDNAGFSTIPTDMRHVAALYAG